MKFFLFLAISYALFLGSCTKGSTPPPPVNPPVDSVPVVITPPKPDTMPRFTGVYPLRAKIGDTLTLSGKNFSKIVFLRFNTSVTNARILSRSDTQMVTVVPVLNDEKSTVHALIREQNNYVPHDSISFNLVGVFPLFYSFEGADIAHISAVSEKVYYASVAKKLFKTTDGGYNWTMIREYSEFITSIFFVDEQHGWLSIYDTYGCRLLYTKDGGLSAESKFSTTSAYDGRYITDMYFSSLTAGYILTGKGELYSTKDNTNFTKIYTYPNSNIVSNYPEFTSLSVFGRQLLASGNSGKRGDEPTLIKGQEGALTTTNFGSGNIGNVQLVNETQAYAVRDAFYLYSSPDGGNTWNKTSDTRIYNMHFFTRDAGFGISSDDPYSRHWVMQTTDGGHTWMPIYKMFDFEFVICTGFVNPDLGLFGGYRGHMWKYIKP